MKEKEDFEVFCYESEDGEMRLEFGEATISFSKKRFIEVAEKLNQIREVVLDEYLRQLKNDCLGVQISYRI